MIFHTSITYSCDRHWQAEDCKPTRSFVTSPAAHFTQSQILRGSLRLVSRGASKYPLLLPSLALQLLPHISPLFSSLSPLCRPLSSLLVHNSFFCHVPEHHVTKKSHLPDSHGLHSGHPSRYLPPLRINQVGNTQVRLHMRSIHPLPLSS